MGQIEQAKRVPTITVIAKLAMALSLTVTTMITVRTRPGVVVLPAPRASPPRIAVASRALTPHHDHQQIELYELQIAAGCAVASPACASRTRKNLVVSVGAFDVEVSCG